MISNLPAFFRIWLTGTSLLLLLQSYGGGLTQDESTSFYIGYFATPFFFGLLIALVAFLVFKYWE